MRRRVWVGLAGVAVAAALGYSILMAIDAAGAYYLTIPEAQAQAAAMQGRPVRVQGVVQGGSIEWEMARLALSFAIHDESDPTRSLQVRYQGTRPDGLEDGRTVIVEGRLSPDGRAVEASTLMVQCPSRYEVDVSKL
ncbi:MAG: cytochrome c maturation protein CcmE [Firmicutes bacterium]|uniref:Cytochrome c maturation protein CcmE n=1 Tax=Geochorda subterranea TaxID=3109564 RepID=A0ABZ1BMR8_9FIRM|nr:cytochrome c maturation protein CcmE [Limnochorda sp. LNt]NLG69748.1 cytochrome c maturation protein CcmE [Bacillota bacterium]WRP14112.1 cytochrome c maturation protein CcmE [Limnochorda sp. LNt]